MNLLRIQAIFVILCCCAPTFSQDLKAYYKADKSLIGVWSIDLLRSHSTEDGGIFFTTLSFTEDSAQLDSLQHKIASLNLLQRTEIGIDTLAGFHITGVGRGSAIFEGQKGNKKIELSMLYAIVRSGAETKIAMFMDDAEFMREFSPCVLLEVLNDSGKENGQLHAAWPLIKAEYYYEPIGLVKDFSPIRRNKLNALNTEGLYGAVKSVYTKYSESMRTRNGNFVAQELQWVEKATYNKRGELTSSVVSGQRGKLMQYTVTGNYMRSLHRLEGIRVNYASDSMLLEHTSDLETLSAYENGKLDYQIRSSLVNGRATSRTVLRAGGSITTVYKYNEKGDLASATPPDPNYDNPRYYVYLRFDLHGNWTKRIATRTPGNIERGASVEVRVIEYYK